MKRSLIYITSLALVLSSCDKNEEWPQPDNGSAVEITATVAADATTRVNTESDATQFLAGDEIYLENVTLASNHSRRSSIYRYDGAGKWTPKYGNYVAWFEQVNNGIAVMNEFEACAPATEGTTINDFILPADQSTIEKLRLADYMTASTSDKPDTDKFVDLKFSHQMAKIKITITDYIVQLEDYPTDVRILSPGKGYADRTVQSGETAVGAYVQLDEIGYYHSFTAVIAPGKYSDSPLLEFTIGGTKYTVQAPDVLKNDGVEAGKYYRMYIRVTKPKIYVQEFNVYPWETFDLGEVGLEETSNNAAS